jgi:hypothetical protein
MVRKGEPWERPAGGPPEESVQGGDADLAAAVEAHPGARIAFDPAADSDLARAVGLARVLADRGPGSLELPLDATTPGIELPLDAMRVTADGAERMAVNMLVLGTPPDRLGPLSSRVAMRITVDGRPSYDGKATTVLVASGQHLRGADAVPRGHPGDGRLEIQAYAPTVGEARAVRDRLATGTHVPHPHIAQATGRRVEVELGRAVRLELDGVERGRARLVVVEVVPEAFSLVV